MRREYQPLLSMSRRTAPQHHHGKTISKHLLLLSYFNWYFKVVGGFKKDPEDDQGEICGVVEELDLDKKVWKLGPSLTVPRSALNSVQVDNFFQ